MEAGCRGWTGRGIMTLGRWKSDAYRRDSGGSHHPGHGKEEKKKDYYPSGVIHDLHPRRRDYTGVLSTGRKSWL
ncbi:hypothetical protein NDU88_003873 [Pleurodeles waltl]|uniref:Uncharacterized protein n=1 Tax=Pleurodeles waltl TaxID=8319 RepID=A0AAV7T6I2_PLEWA|nr:hypothetical protein NDU88_003873 [Pleurodeles waltl]